MELVGTNTMYEQVNTGTVNPGDIREVKFHQKWNLQNGDFLLSLGCTGYENGEFVVYSKNRIIYLSVKLHLHKYRIISS